ncbi:MFS general substrate transporter [Mollisia scopiformis]|uniref:MFS general substrate transporter n=1 Tax=Mollisia scopiformis TaxID=149040 RepID=A0A194X4Z2_MOLSC|nr:MFS general substrate transporter [Mollisia scopiformis]KUJ15246.1 MFS general substrate transporter [Mollisia scopiformis]
MSLVWLSGPISGAIVQPYILLCSDRCESKWGRRRPFIAGGATAIVISLIGLAWSKELILGLASVFGSEQEDKITASTTAATAVLFVFALNIAVQPVQGGLRTLIVDTCPKEQQESANAWAGRIICTANVSSYVCGYIDLPFWFPFLGETQFKVLCVITSILLVASVGLTCWSAKESPAATLEAGLRGDMGLFRKLTYLTTSFRRLHPEVKRVCATQFFSWMGWFPFLFYINIYIGEKYLDSSPTHSYYSQAPISQADMTTAARTGSFGMLMFAIISLISGIAIPLLIHATDRTQHHPREPRLMSTILDTIFTWTSSTRRLWMLSQILYATCMLVTLVVSSLVGTFILVGLAGISWAVTIWAPFAIINTAILSDADDENEETGGDNYERGMGTIIGLHNVAIAVPQIVSALVCGFVFWVSERLGFEDGVGWVLRIGGISALAAAFLTTRLNYGNENSEMIATEEYKLEEMDQA